MNLICLRALSGCRAFSHAFRAQDIARLCLLALLGSSMQNASAADDLSRGLEAYKLKDYKAAAHNFEKAAKSDPYKAELHYYLANSYVFLKNADGAMREYERCFDLEPLSKVGQYSREALLKYGNKFRGLRGRVASGASSVDEPQSMKKAVEQIRSQTCQKELIHQTIAEQAAKRAMSNGEVRNLCINKAAEELSEDIAAQGKSHLPQVQEELHAIRQKAVFDGQRALHDAHEEAARQMSHAISKSSGLEDSASNLLSLMGEKPRPGKVKVRANGTNLYARNYSFDPAPPPVPLCAEWELLPSLQKKSKKTAVQVAEIITSQSSALPAAYAAKTQAPPAPARIICKETAKTGSGDQQRNSPVSPWSSDSIVYTGEGKYCLATLEKSNLLHFDERSRSKYRSK